MQLWPCWVYLIRKEEIDMNEQKKEMTQEREIAILEGAIKKFGYREQVIVAIEEMAELQKELTKWLGSKGKTAGLLEEMADVSIMLNQLQLIFGDPVEQEIAKLERLEGLVMSDGD